MTSLSVAANYLKLQHSLRIYKERRKYMQKGIKDFEELYLRDEYGRIFSTKTGIERKPYISNKGYKCIDLYANGECKKYLVHRLTSCSSIYSQSK